MKMNFNNKKTKKVAAFITLFVVFAMVASLLLPAFV